MRFGVGRRDQSPKIPGYPPPGGYPGMGQGGAPYPPKPTTSRKPPPKPPFFTPFTIRGRRHLAAAVIVAGLVVSHVYQSGVVQDTVDGVRQTIDTHLPSSR